jgi:hypothetical protein
VQRAQETRSALRQQVESGATLRDDHRFLRVMGVDSSEVSCVHAVTDVLTLRVFHFILSLRIAFDSACTDAPSVGGIVQYLYLATVCRCCHY